MHLVARVILLNNIGISSIWSQRAFSVRVNISSTNSPVYNEKDYKCFASLIVYNVHQVCMFYNKVV